MYTTSSTSGHCSASINYNHVRSITKIPLKVIHVNTQAVHAKCFRHLKRPQMHPPEIIGSVKLSSREPRSDILYQQGDDTETNGRTEGLRDARHKPAHGADDAETKPTTEKPGTLNAAVECPHRVELAQWAEESPEPCHDCSAGKGAGHEASERLARCERKAEEAAGKRRRQAAPGTSDSGCSGVCP